LRPFDHVEREKEAGLALDSVGDELSREGQAVLKGSIVCLAAMVAMTNSLSRSSCAVGLRLH
jgi:hypothetical protein